MEFLIYYAFGLCAAGLLFTIFICIDSFHTYMINSIKKAKAKMKEDEKYGLMEQNMIDNIDNEAIINTFSIVTTFLSWIGLIIVIFNILAWIVEFIKNKFNK